MPTVMTASEIAPVVRSRGAAASRAIREITLTVGCLLILRGARLVYKPPGRPAATSGRRSPGPSTRYPRNPT